ncbi:MAG: hypothetical protein JW987_09850 [Anaerolineaceae bacterium]|nr:hypothetical protein [Anaerolineaceae bacterium]
MKKKKHPNQPEEVETPLPGEQISPESETPLESVTTETPELMQAEALPVEPVSFEAAAPAAADAEEIINPSVQAHARAEAPPAEPFGLPAEEAPAPPEPPIAETLLAQRKPINPWMAAGVVGLISLFLSVCLSLSILGAANGGLRYGSKNQVLLMQSEIAGLTAQLNEQEQELATLRSRLQALEALDSRVSSMEQESTALSQEIENQTSEVQAVREELQATQSELEKMAAGSRDFQTFLQGLAELLSKLQSTQEAIP